MSDSSLMLRAVGDITLGDHPLCVGFGAHSRYQGRSAGFAFEHVRSTLADADIVFGNLECTLSTSGLRRRSLHSVQMRGWPRYAEDLQLAGFTVLNVANNHSLQHGRTAFLESVRLLREHGIAVCGLHDGRFKHAEPVFIERKGLRVAFLGYSMRPRQYFADEPLYAEGFRDEMLEDIRDTRAQADCLVVSLHWGSEFIDRPSPEEVALAHLVVDAGADLIVGHHPHVLRGVGQCGRAPVVYSLGNFVCDMIWDERLRETAIMECRLSSAGASSIRMLPVRINDDYQPELLVGEHCSVLSQRIEAMSSELQQEGESPPEIQEQYEQAAEAALRENRSLSHKYFLLHLHRYSPTLLVQQFLVWLSNRLTERGLKRVSSHPSSC